jgi:hypothetical protein
MVKDDYQCCRCGYKTFQKGRIRRHLYHLKKPCPSTSHDIELTDDIKQYILDNRIYKIPETKPATNIITNYNQINNFISSMDIQEKLNKYIKYKNIEIMDFEDQIEDHFNSHIKKLDTNRYSSYRLDFDDMLDVIDKVTYISKNVENFNIYYDEIPNKLKIFTCGEWNTLLLDAGIKQMLHKIKACYLDTYECYLLRKLNDSNIGAHSRMQFKEHLLDYFKFLSCFDISPYVSNASDGDILKNNDDSYDLQDEWYPKFKGIKESITVTEANKVKKEVKDIVKRNTKSNIIELNKLIMQVFNADTEFKENIINNIESELHATQAA